MNKTYKLLGLRNQKHANLVFDQISAFNHHGDIHVDKKQHRISLSLPEDYEYVARIVAYEKVGLQLLSPSTDHIKTEISHHDGHHHQHEIDFSKGEQATRNMLLVFFINIVFSILEFIFGWLFNSAAILSDAVHDFGDALSIGLAWIFQKISTRGSNTHYTYGYRRFSLLGALITSIVLLISSVFMVIYAGGRVLQPQVVNYQGMFWLAILAIIVNGYSAWLISRGSSHNESILSLHLLEDVLGWVGVLIVSIVLNFTDWYILDPLLSIAIAVFIFYKTLPEFIEVCRLFLQAVPADIDVSQLRQQIEGLPNINSVAHFHIWSMDGEFHMISLTITTSVSDIKEHETIKNKVRDLLVPKNITHSNIELIYDPEKVL